MAIRLTALGLALAGALAGCQAPSPGPSPGARSVAEVIAAAATDAAGMTTYKVSSIGQEYEVLAALGLTPTMQALVIDDQGRPFDVIETDGGPVRFDVSSFFGQGF